MPTPFNEGEVEPQRWVLYKDAQFRNTKKDAHALDRKELVVSDNTWTQQGNTLSKRPGSISLPGVIPGSFGAISAGATGLGVGFIGGAEGRWFDQTAVLLVGAISAGQSNVVAATMELPEISIGSINAYVSIGTISGGRIQGAQLFDPDPSNPNGPEGSLFITNGLNIPQRWNGPGNPLVPVVAGQLPTKADGSGKPITPKYCCSFNNSLFYAGEPTDPSMVYISDAWRPQQFTTNVVQPTGTITGSNYIGMPIGRGDGIDGGSITGLRPLLSAVIVYKQSAVYQAQNFGLLGDQVWGASVLSPSVGLTAPQSLVAFDSFHVGLGIDGVYVYSLYPFADGSYTWKISKNNPDLFDGATARIMDRTSAVGVRMGNRYIIWFDDGAGTGVPIGYPTVGACFDFDKPDADGLPCVTTISGMNPGVVLPLRGPDDVGNFFWASALSDQAGAFAATVGGLQVYSDFGVPITVTLLGKADFFDDIWEDEAPSDFKVASMVHLLVSFPIIAPTQSYSFSGSLIFDLLTTQTSQGLSQSLPPVSTAIVGSAVVGTATLGVVGGQPAYQEIEMAQAEPGFGRIVQLGVTETSSLPWTLLGYQLLINRQRHIAGSQ